MSICSTPFYLVRVQPRLNCHKQSGFTLIELMISLTILAFLGYFTSEMMRNTTQQSQKIRTEVDISREVKAAARVIRGDISRAFNSRDIYIAVYNEAQRERVREWQRNQMNPQQSQNQGAGGQDQDGNQGNDSDGNNNPNDPNNPNAANPNITPPPTYEPREELIVTQFLGEKNKIDLTSISGVRIRKNVKASDLIEVGYYTANCRKRAERNETTNCLWRRISYFLDGEVNVGGTANVLLENVTRFELQYMRVRGENIEWIDSWKSDQNGDDVTRDSLPMAVRLDLEVERALDKSGNNKKAFSLLNYIPIYFTNNSNVKLLTQMNSQGNPFESAPTGGGLGGEGASSPFGSGPGLTPNNNSSPFGQGGLGRPSTRGNSTAPGQMFPGRGSGGGRR